MKTGISSHSEPMATRVALHPFLAGMNRTQLTLLTDCAMPAHFTAGEMILHEGEQANRFYLIEKGRVALEAHAGSEQRVVIETAGPGDLLGWSCLFPPYIWHFTARAIEPTDAIVFYGSIVREYCDRDHSLGYELFKRVSAVMIKRLQAAREKLLANQVGDAPVLPGQPSPFMDQELDVYADDNGGAERRRVATRS